MKILADAGRRFGVDRACTADGGVAVQALFVKNHRNAEPAVFQKVDIVGQLRHAARGAIVGGIARAAGIAEPWKPGCR
jgi:hypothetical protein